MATPTGTDLKIERIRRGVRQYRLAAALGWPPTTVWAIEAGRKPVSPEQAAAINRALQQLAPKSPQADDAPAA